MAKTYRYKQLLKQFSILKNKMNDLTPFWHLVIPVIHNMTMGRFSKGGPGWAALAPSTITQRIRQGTWRVGVGADQPILQREGDLRRSVMSSGLASSAHFETIRKTSLTYGTRLKKAVYLQKGTADLEVDKWIPGAPRSAYPGKLAPRPFLFFEDEDAEDILDVGALFLDKQLRDVL